MTDFELGKEEAFEILATNAVGFYQLGRMLTAKRADTDPGKMEAEKSRIEVQAAIKVLKPYIYFESSHKATLTEQLLFVLKDGQKTTGEIIEAISNANPVSVKKVIKQATDAGLIEKVKHGIYKKATQADQSSQTLI